MKKTNFKKSIKTATVTVVVGFALTGFGGTVLAATGYIVWPGSDAYNSVLVSINTFVETASKLKAENTQVKQSNEVLGNQLKDKDNVIKDKENAIKAKEQEVAAKQKEIDELKNSSNSDKAQLKQAETDMKDVDQKMKDAVNAIK